MLRQDNSARLTKLPRGFLYLKVGFQFKASGVQPVWLDAATQQAIETGQHARLPLALVRNGKRRWWVHEGEFYWEDEGYSAEDVLALVRDRQRKEKRKLDRARTLLAAEETTERRSREPVPVEMRRAVFERDGGRCVQCGSGFDLQYDHILPVALGGATTLDNLQILCADCNREKSDSV
jgi:hypothetical protein